LESGEITVYPKETTFYTEPLVETDVEILVSEQQSRRLAIELNAGQVLVTREVSGYVKKHTQYKSVLERCALPETLIVPLKTKALWVLIADRLIEALVEHQHDPAGSLHAVEHAMIALLPLFVLGD